MPAAYADFVPVVACVDLCWGVSAGGGSVAELAGTVIAPAPECVVGFDGARMVISGADVVPFVACDPSWGISVGSSSVAELTVVVVAPAPECVVGFGDTCAVVTRDEGEN